MTSKPRIETLGHVASLDGVRAIAVLLVMGYHAALPGFDGGQAGVDMFFVLSGFLITSLLLVERDRNHRINLPAFYMRRVLRLYPALLVAIAGAVALAALRVPIFHTPARGVGNTLGVAPYSLFYTMNIARAMGWNTGGLLAHTWSLAIEEQFYLIWPIVTIIVLGRRSGLQWLLAIATIGAVASASLRAGLFAAGAEKAFVYNATFTHVDGILAGCALGIGWAAYRGVLRRFAHPILPIVVFAVGFVITVRGEHMYTYGYAAFALLTVVLINDMLARPESRAARMLAHRVPVAIGRRSYGLYLYHFPIFVFIGMTGGLLDAAIGFAAAFAAAWFSFAYIERPFLRMKTRWSV